MDAHRPSVGRSRAPASDSSVDFPDPEGPMIATSSPASTSSDNGPSARTAWAPDPWIRPTSSRLNTAVARTCSYTRGAGRVSRDPWRRGAIAASGGARRRRPRDRRHDQPGRAPAISPRPPRPVDRARHPGVLDVHEQRAPVGREARAGQLGAARHAAGDAVELAAARDAHHVVVIAAVLADDQVAVGATTRLSGPSSSSGWPRRAGPRSAAPRARRRAPGRRL